MAPGQALDWFALVAHGIPAVLLAALAAGAVRELSWSLHPPVAGFDISIYGYTMFGLVQDLQCISSFLVGGALCYATHPKQGPEAQDGVARATAARSWRPQVFASSVFW
mmetsp:Transcript_93717/g.292036  ORF Transcript_93717/g.292036 Transcript_93717/m.292036 type:complete len:109 (+) Transcript_93717:122-448(+)